MKSDSPITHEEISQRARNIWEQARRPEGQETEHWLRAERELRQEREQIAEAKGADNTPMLVDTKSSSAPKSRHVPATKRPPNN